MIDEPLYDAEIPADEPLDEPWFDDFEKESKPPVTLSTPEITDPKDFSEKWAMAEKLLAEKGDLVGLCKSCLNTGYCLVYREGYHFIEYRPDEAKIQPIKCMHGENPVASFDF